MQAAGSDEILKKVKDFAAQAHGGQERKFSAEPYIAHPVRVMETCRAYTSDIAVLAAALLHDVLEDTEVEEDEIRSFLVSVMGHENADRTMKLVVELTDVYVKANYPKWNRRKRKDKEAARHAHSSAASQTVKYADIIDNVKGISNVDSDFVKVFLYECRSLLRKMNKGDSGLYQRAVSTVNEQIEKLKKKNKDSGR